MPSKCHKDCAYHIVIKMVNVILNFNVKFCICKFIVINMYIFKLCTLLSTKGYLNWLNHQPKACCWQGGLRSQVSIQSSPSGLPATMLVEPHTIWIFQEKGGFPQGLTWIKQVIHPPITMLRFQNRCASAPTLEIKLCTREIIWIWLEKSNSRTKNHFTKLTAKLNAQEKH